MMGGLYPNLYEKFKTENVCPICLIEMGNTPKYECENGHVMCHRCKPHFYGCSACQGHLYLVPTAQSFQDFSSPGFQNYPQPDVNYYPLAQPTYPPREWLRGGPRTTSPPSMDFLENERRAWGAPTPPPDQHLVCCRYVIYGCEVKVPDSLQQLHEVRCQFRPYLEVEHLPTDLSPGDDLVSCIYEAAGCHVRMPPWRQPIHEPLCFFKERFEAMESGEPTPSEPEEDLEELLECKLVIYGCQVKMPRRRKLIHEEKCNYNKYYNEEDFRGAETEEVQEDPDLNEQVPCRWAEQGCQIKPKLYRKEIHEEKCNYKMDPCSYADHGCEELVFATRRYPHERNCLFRI